MCVCVCVGGVCVCVMAYSMNLNEDEPATGKQGRQKLFWFRLFYLCVWLGVLLFSNADVRIGQERKPLFSRKADRQTDKRPPFQSGAHSNKPKHDRKLDWSLLHQSVCWPAKLDTRPSRWCNKFSSLAKKPTRKKRKITLTVHNARKLTKPPSSLFTSLFRSFIYSIFTLILGRLYCTMDAARKTA